jgi:(1->4)-alpha-D-glucan 1-alpha-D-glucosylmutase
MTVDEILDRIGRDPSTPLRVPRATYRLQLGPALSFDDAADLADYLAELGISDCYTSPFFETSGAGSHGYDVADHNRLRAELGGEEGFARFADALKRRELGLLVDIVPNHMGIAQARNAWWRDVLEHGPASPHAPAFDVDWHPVKRELYDKVLLPILGDQYGAVLDAGQLRLERQGGRFVIRYYDTVLPVGPRSYARILGLNLEDMNRRLGPEHPAAIEIKSLLGMLATLPVRTETDPARLALRRHEVESAMTRFEALLKEWPDARDYADASVAAFNGTPGDPRSFDRLDALLDAQVYRLAYWRVAGEEINYRRFFDINDLAAIRMEIPEVFAASHRLLFKLVRDGIVTGLRIDHPDGLYRPAEYFHRLQRNCLREVCHGLVRGAPGEWRDQELLGRYEAVQTAATAPVQPFYIVAEKILAHGERLPETWAVAGTTGYEVLNLVNGIFVDRTNARAIDDIYTRVRRAKTSFPDVVYESKRLIMDTSMASEMNMLAYRLNRISESHRASRDFTLNSLRRALREIIAAFPVYRTYLGDDEGTEGGGGKTLSPQASDANREALERAVSAAKRRTPTVDPSIYDWIQELLSLAMPPWADARHRQERYDFVMRFQQITGPITAKGFEDTALYRYQRLVSLNEVGGEPSRFGTTLAEFHAMNVERARHGAGGLTATSTHDTKRGEDTRVRIDVLSELPAEWRTTVSRWQRLNRRHRTTIDRRQAPSPTEEYLIYQTLVGAWPLEAERLRDYVLKAAREAKENTSWTNPNHRWDEALTRFVEAILDRQQAPEFLSDLRAFHGRIAPFGILSSLAQTLIKITIPGVPDFYQCTECWDLSLVDPDNRRPVDFPARRESLRRLTAEIEAAGGDLAPLARRLMNDAADPRVKLFVIRQALAVRRRHAELFARGDYRPLDTRGALADHVCAFARTGPGGPAITVVPRILAARGVSNPVGEFWSDTTLILPPEAAVPLRNAFTGAAAAVQQDGEGRTLRLSTVFADFPVALLETAA